MHYAHSDRMCHGNLVKEIRSTDLSEAIRIRTPRRRGRRKMTGFPQYNFTIKYTNAVTTVTEVTAIIIQANRRYDHGAGKQPDKRRFGLESGKGTGGTV